MTDILDKLILAVSRATNNAQNETQLRHEIEKALEVACEESKIPWTPFQLDRSLRAPKSTKFTDVAHGAVIIEYEPPNSFKSPSGLKLSGARAQAEEYAHLLADEEGRKQDEYVLVAWDGRSINFGRLVDSKGKWESLLSFDKNAAERLMRFLASDGIPLVHPRLLTALVGPDSTHGQRLIPLLFKAICNASEAERTTKSKLLFTEWRRLFGQVVGVQTEPLKRLLELQGLAHGEDYSSAPSAYLFALNTYIALLAKLVAASAIPNPNTNVLDNSVPIKYRLSAFESGSLFESAGILNMLSADFFSWYLDDPMWTEFQAHIESLMAAMAGMSFDVTRKSPDSTRDLFKGIYQNFVPRALRHAMGEFYTPDWLAEHALNVLNWSENDDLLDPTCGSGTFLLEALRRRLKKGKYKTAQSLLGGLHGIDLNPLAVLTSKGSLAVFIAPYLDPNKPIRIPVYLADAINPAMLQPDGCYTHELLTELGPFFFRVPKKIVSSPAFFRSFNRMREAVDDNRSVSDITAAVKKELAEASFTPNEDRALSATIDNFWNLHRRGWNGIWCSILADRLAAGDIQPVRYICGNPPWVKWSNLPPEYAKYIQPRCREIGVFSTDRWVGGIESDISTVITYEVIDKYLQSDGTLGFFINSTVFSTESHEGFRAFSLRDGKITCSVQVVHDFTSIRPFDGVSNSPTFLVLVKGHVTSFPVPFIKWFSDRRNFTSAKDFLQSATTADLIARPVPGGSGSRPWLIGSEPEHEVFQKVFGEGKPHYRARKGVTTDRNGIYWVRPLGQESGGRILIQNDPSIGRIHNIAQSRKSIETTYLFPLIRGRGVRPFNASIESDLRIIVPQTGMHGDPDLETNAVETYRFLRQFRDELQRRSSFRKFQAAQGAPYWSVWSTGAYTFAPYKVLWKEIKGSSFAAAYIGPVVDPILGEKVVVPDHKLYMIAVTTEDEAAYVTGLLNAPIVANAVNSYAAQLSLGASVAEYLHIPSFDSSDTHQQKLIALSKAITARGGSATNAELTELEITAGMLLYHK